MTKHTMVTFQLHRKGVTLIVVLAIVLAVLLVAAGYFAGNARARAAAKPKPVAKKPAAAVKNEPKESFALRVALVASEEEANAAVKRLKIKKLAATIVPKETSESMVVYEVRVGPYPGRDAAIAAAQSLKRDHGLDSAVVPAEQ